MTAPLPDAYTFCLQTLRDTDRDRYLACLLVEPDKRGPLAALYAFNAEIARVRDLVREPLPGEIRLQWWRDVIEASGSVGDAQANPLAQALLAVIAEYRLPVGALTGMIEARIFDLYDDPMADVATLEGYAGETASALVQLASLILAPETAAQSASAAGHAGVAQAIAGLLLLMPLHRRRGQVYVPQDLLAATGFDRDSFLACEDPARLEPVVAAFAGLGRDHLKQAREQGAIARANFPAFLPVALTGPVLDLGSRQGGRMALVSGGLSQWRRQWYLWRASRRLRF